MLKTQVVSEELSENDGNDSSTESTSSNDVQVSIFIMLDLFIK